MPGILSSCRQKTALMPFRDPALHCCGPEITLGPMGTSRQTTAFNSSPDFHSHSLIITLLVQGLMCPPKAAQGMGNALGAGYRCNPVSL